MSNKTQSELLAEEARRVIESPAYKTAMMVVKAKVVQDFENTNLFQKRKREDAWRKLKLLRSLEAELKKQIESGALEEKRRETRNRHQKLRGL